MADTKTADLTWARLVEDADKGADKDSNSNKDATNLHAMRIGQLEQNPVDFGADGPRDYMKADWGWWMAVAEDARASSVIAERATTRSAFAANGTVSDIPDDDGSPRPASDGFVSMALSFDLGTSASERCVIAQTSTLT